jgi:hypothetical protein
VPSQIVVVPEILAGFEGAVLTVIAKVVEGLLPQALLAFTLILPLVVLAFVVILFVVDVPDHPPGKLQLYEVAPATVVIE